MKLVFLKKNNLPTLTIFFLGWGMDEKVCANRTTTNSDFMVCYDYKSLDFNYDILDNYSGINIIGWSMGVWAASVIIEHIKNKSMPIIIHNSIAINGTVTPIDDKFGIPTAIYQGTLNNLSERTLEKFNRRMCGTKEELLEFNTYKPQQSIDNLKQELSFISKAQNDNIANANGWNKAIIGESDMIFPKENQINAWNMTKYTETIICPIAHYSKKTIENTIAKF